MRLSAVVKPQSDENLRLLAQLGVEDWVYYDMKGLPSTLEALEAEAARARRCGVNLSVVEGGPAIDRIVLGKSGRDAQIEHYKRSLQHLGKIGCRVLCWNFMPQILDDAMVVRTSFEVPERGGALTSGFDGDQFDWDNMTGAGKTTDEEMWENLDYFLERIIPAAEEAEVKLALHPDDPPLSPLWNLSRIIRSPEAYERIFSAHPSPVNGMTLCMGCFLEMEVAPAEALRRFRDRVFFIHFRDVLGAPRNFRETFPDNGPTDMAAFLQTCKAVDYKGFLRVDHVPQLAVESKAKGYGLLGHTFGIGYLKGLMEPVFGK